MVESVLTQQIADMLLANIDDFLRLRITGNTVDIWCAALHPLIVGNLATLNQDTYPTGAGYYRCRAVSMRKLPSLYDCG